MLVRAKKHYRYQRLAELGPRLLREPVLEHFISLLVGSRHGIQPVRDPDTFRKEILDYRSGRRIAETRRDRNDAKISRFPYMQKQAVAPVRTLAGLNYAPSWSTRCRR